MENENEEEDEENNNESSNDEITQQKDKKKDKKNNFKKSMNAKNSIVILSKNDMNEPIVQQNLRELVLKQQEYIKTGEGDIKRSSKTKKKIVSNMFQFSFSLIGCLIGSGILSLANACKQMGIVGFVAWIIATNVYYWYTWTYFNKAIYITGSSTIGEMFSLIFGNTFAIIVDICNTLFYCCILICDQVIATQYIFGIIQDLTTRDQWDNTLDECYGNPQRIAGVACNWHYIILYLIVLCANLPLIIPKNVKFLSKIAILTLIAAIFTSFSVVYKMIYHSITGTSANNSDKNYPTLTGKLWPESFMSFFTMAPFITANFQVNSCMPPLYAGTKGMSKRSKYASIEGGSILSIVISSVLFILVAVSGNVIFDSVSSNILNDFLNSNSSTIDWHILVCRALMIIVVLVAYPMAMLPASAGIVRYLPKKWKIVRNNNGFAATLLVKMCILILTTFCSSFITNIGAIFSIGSSIFSIFICYIGPLSTIMLWPRIEKFGNPEFRKLSVVDRILYGKDVDGKQYFENKEVEIALSKTSNSNSDDVVVQIEKDEHSSNEHDEMNALFFTVDKKQFEEEDLNPLRKKTMKLPYVEIPKWRYAVFIIAMIICVILCILSVVGTLIG